jgi:glucose-6-phosphate-specific signal transduction histidine kinase
VTSELGGSMDMRSDRGTRVSLTLPVRPAATGNR